MSVARIHLVRHGEVDNPGGVLYARLPGFHLTAQGRRMADAAAEHLLSAGSEITRVISSPLERAVESALPFAQRAGVPIERRDGVIEAASHLEGGKFAMDLSILAKPAAWPFLVNPFRPSWGEPFRSVADRMMAEIDHIAASTGSGEAVIVSHQMPIWMVHRVLSGRPLFHDPRRRRCALSSITTIERAGTRWREVGYWAARLEDEHVTDTGAV